MFIIPTKVISQFLHEKALEGQCGREKHDVTEWVEFCLLFQKQSCLFYLNIWTIPISSNRLNSLSNFPMLSKCHPLLVPSFITSRMVCFFIGIDWKDSFSIATVLSNFSMTRFSMPLLSLHLSYVEGVEQLFVWASSFELRCHFYRTISEHFLVSDQTYYMFGYIRKVWSYSI